jgi:hypothetical protein
MSKVEIEGIYDKRGRVKLSRSPKGVKVPSRVMVRFLEAAGEGVDAERQAAIDLVLADLQEGLHLGGAPYPKREDLHDRDQR